MRSSDDNPVDPADLIRFGTVAEVDLGAGTVVVDSGDVRSGSIRWAGGRAGATRSWSPPSVGEQVLLLCPGGELAAAVAIGGIPQNAFPPAGNSTRELIEFADGAVLAYDPEAHVLDVALPAGARVNIVAAGGVTIDAADGGLSITGDVTVDGKLTASGDVKAGDISLQDHVHTKVAAGTAKSGKPE
ncbi:MAG TPA: phage baseplate assembly protein V [Allosphingosinicella sp.]|jgi:phage baseplate assembly protein V